MQIVSNIALLSINETMIVQLISFLIFLYIINRVMIRPLRGVMTERAEHMENVKREIVNAELKLKEVTEQIQQRNNALRREAIAISEKLEAAGNQEADKLIAATRQEILTWKTQAAKDVDLQVQEARKYIHKESETLSVAIMEKILERRQAT